MATGYRMLTVEASDSMDIVPSSLMIIMTIIMTMFHLQSFSHDFLQTVKDSETSHTIWMM